MAFQVCPKIQISARLSGRTINIPDRISLTIFVHILSMPYRHNDNQKTLSLDCVHDPVVAYPDAIVVFNPFQLLHSWRIGVFSK